MFLKNKACIEVDTTYYDFMFTPIRIYDMYIEFDWDISFCSSSYPTDFKSLSSCPLPALLTRMLLHRCWALPKIEFNVLLDQSPDFNRPPPLTN